MSAFIESLHARAAVHRRRIVFPEGTDERILEAVATLQRERLVEPVVIGPVEAVRRGVVAAGGDGEALEVVDPFHDPRREAFARELYALRSAKGMTRGAADERVIDALVFGALMVRAGEVDGCVAGAVRPTGDVLRAALWCVGPMPEIRTVSSAFYMVTPPFRGGDAPEVLTFTDGGVVPDPDAEQLADIAITAATERRKIVGDEPRVAFLSYSTRGSAEGPSVSKVREALRIFREREPEIPADGELQADAALIASVSQRKAPYSPVPGDANVLVFPDLDSGNIAYKLVQRLAGAEALGPIVQGLTRPCNDLSRGASVYDIVNVACITALQS